VRRVTSPPIVGDVTTSLYGSSTTSQHSIEGPTFLEAAPRRLSSVDSLIAILEVIRVKSVYAIALPTTYFCLRPDTQSIDLANGSFGSGTDRVKFGSGQLRVKSIRIGYGFGSGEVRVLF